MNVPLENLSNKKDEIISFVDRKTVNWIRFDSGGEFITMEFCDWVKKRRLFHELTTAYSH